MVEVRRQKEEMESSFCILDKLRDFWIRKEESAMSPLFQPLVRANLVT